MKWLDDDEGIGITEAVALVRYYFRISPNKHLECAVCHKAYPFISCSSGFYVKDRSVVKSDGSNAIISVLIQIGGSILSMLEQNTEGICDDCCNVSGWEVCYTVCRTCPLEYVCMLRVSPVEVHTSTEIVCALVSGSFPKYHF